jgi:hypothetical protein
VAEAVDFTVSVELPEALIEAGAKLALTPVGSPDAVNATVPVNPFSAATVVVKVVELPAATVCDTGDADKLKSAVCVTGFTVTLTAVLCDSVPLVPVIVGV